MAKKAPKKVVKKVAKTVARKAAPAKKVAKAPAAAVPVKVASVHARQILDSAGTPPWKST